VALHDTGGNAGGDQKKALRAKAFLHKDFGLVTDIFSRSVLEESLQGHCSIGQTPLSLVFLFPFSSCFLSLHVSFLFMVPFSSCFLSLHVRRPHALLDSGFGQVDEQHPALSGDQQPTQTEPTRISFEG
jgi:hypothetical protein